MATKHVQLTAAKREGSGKGTARATRRENRIPAVIYGDNKAPVCISIEVKPITLEYNKGHLFTTLCDLDVEGTKHMVITRDLQLDPVTDNIVHVDFLRVTDKTTIRVEVPVHFKGQENSMAIKDGAVLTVIMHEIELMCPANSIPEEVVIDVSSTPVGHAFKLSEVKLPAGVKPAAHDPESVTVATLHAPRKAEEVAETAAPAAAEVPATKVAAPDAAAAAAAGAKKDEKKK
ncbi:MAG: 50S ribosomal protein L25/general stress protein Ctc [Alphaproteobacteria bacterium]|nr:50S ribosomal protein L25/general stress protein Ctc [Alphaproteobacteria bacterium]